MQNVLAQLFSTTQDSSVSELFIGDTSQDSHSPGSRKLTLKCLSIGTPKIIKFPFVSNGKLMIFRYPNIQTDYNEAVLCLNFGTSENNEFSIWDKWKIYYF